MERMLINGQPIDVPTALRGGGPELAAFWQDTFKEELPAGLAAGGSAAVEAWRQRQPGAAPPPPVPPADVVARGAEAVERWYRETGHITTPASDPVAPLVTVVTRGAPTPVAPAEAPARTARAERPVRSAPTTSQE